ncbi:MAG: NADH-quinone oxidoreductase E subunit [Myxococcota bacterium]|jgi:NADH-quinone oxidoreductase E subunit
MSLALSPEADAKITALTKRYPTVHAALIPSLWVAQREFGYLSEEALTLIATRLDLAPAKVIATATFYSMFFKKPMGRFHLQVCKNISCYLRGSDAIEKVAAEKLGLTKTHQKTADGLFSYEKAECLGACGRAPIVQVNETYHEWLTPESFSALIDNLRLEAVREVEGAQP